MATTWRQRGAARHDAAVRHRLVPLNKAVSAGPHKAHPGQRGDGQLEEHLEQAQHDGQDPRVGICRGVGGQNYPSASWRRAPEPLQVQLPGYWATRCMQCRTRQRLTVGPSLAVPHARDQRSRHLHQQLAHAAHQLRGAGVERARAGATAATAPCNAHAWPTCCPGPNYKLRLGLARNNVQPVPPGRMCPLASRPHLQALAPHTVHQADAQHVAQQLGAPLHHRRQQRVVLAGACGAGRMRLGGVGGGARGARCCAASRTLATHSSSHPGSGRARGPRTAAAGCR